MRAASTVASTSRAAVGAPVVAAAAGVVRFAGTAGSSGLTVSIRTADGFDTSYLHLSRRRSQGRPRRGGGAVGAVGTSGRRSAERPHLHFGVREAGKRHAYRDPLAFLPALPPATGAPSAAPEPVPAPPPTNPAPAPVQVPARRRVPAAPACPRRAGASPAARRVPRGRRVPNGQPAPARAPRPGTASCAPGGRLPAVRAPAPQRGPAAEPPARPRGMPATRTHLGSAGDLGSHSSPGHAARGPAAAAADAPRATAATPGSSAQPAAAPPRPAARLPRSRGSRGDPRALRRRSCGHPPRRSSASVACSGRCSAAGDAVE